MTSSENTILNRLNSPMPEVQPGSNETSGEQSVSVGVQRAIGTDALVLYNKLAPSIDDGMTRREVVDIALAQAEDPNRVRNILGGLGEGGSVAASGFPTEEEHTNLHDRLSGK